MNASATTMYVLLISGYGSSLSKTRCPEALLAEMPHPVFALADSEAEGKCKTI
jgi:hypothetical protein